MKKSLALLGRLTGISPVKDICPVPKSDRDFSIEGVVIEQTELYNKKNESGIDVADLNTGYESRWAAECFLCGIRT